jgi:hypothetical protein
LSEGIEKMGFSATLGESLARNERDQAALLEKIDDLTLASQSVADPDVSDDELGVMAAKTAAILRSGDVEQIHAILHGLVAQVVIDRHGKQVSGVVDVFVDDATKKKSVRKSGGSVDAHRFTHRFQVSFVVRYKPRGLKLEQPEYAANDQPERQ